mmetsp:Transcript_39588/g.95074  ORF Transcript_39588/g.95074 Transcript_39588/m.95074 type:complete len:452 (+) Transcript_39588:30-1385(+)
MSSVDAFGQGTAGPAAPEQHHRPAPPKGPRRARQVGSPSLPPPQASSLVVRGLGDKPQCPCTPATIWLSGPCEKCRNDDATTVASRAQSDERSGQLGRDSKAKLPWVGGAQSKLVEGKPVPSSVAAPGSESRKLTELAPESDESEEGGRSIKGKWLAEDVKLAAVKRGSERASTAVQPPPDPVASSGQQVPGETDRSATSAAPTAPRSSSIGKDGLASQDAPSPEAARPSAPEIARASPQPSEHAPSRSSPTKENTLPSPRASGNPGSVASSHVEDRRPPPQRPEHAPQLAPPAARDIGPPPQAGDPPGGATVQPPVPGGDPDPGAAGGREPGAPRLCEHGKKVCNYQVVNNCQCTQQNLELYCHHEACVEIKRQQRAEKRKSKSHTRPPLHIRRQKAAEEQANSLGAPGPPGLERAPTQAQPAWQDPSWSDQWARYPQPYYDPYWGSWYY